MLKTLNLKDYTPRKKYHPSPSRVVGHLLITRGPMTTTQIYENFSKEFPQLVSLNYLKHRIVNSMLGKGLLKKKILKESDLTNCPPAKTPIPLAGVVDGKITKPIWLLHQTNKFNVELYKRPLPKTELWKPKNGQPQKSNAGVKILKGFWGKNSQGPKPPPGYYDR